MKLSVNVDHVATVREARGSNYPDPVEAARIAEAAGAEGITVHLRGDRRHVQDDDVRRLRDSLQSRLNLELAPTEEMLALAAAIRPDLVTLVPERPEEITTEGGLDLIGQEGRIAEWSRRLARASVPVSIFLDPESRQIETLAKVRAEVGETIVGFEINTDAYAGAKADQPSALEAVRCAARLGCRHGMAVYAGHALTTANVGAIAAIPEIEELNVGHWLISRSILVGLDVAVGEILNAMAQGKTEGSLR